MLNYALSCILMQHSKTREVVFRHKVSWENPSVSKSLLASSLVLHSLNEDYHLNMTKTFWMALKYVKKKKTLYLKNAFIYLFITLNWLSMFLFMLSGYTVYYQPKNLAMYI